MDRPAVVCGPNWAHSRHNNPLGNRGMGSVPTELLIYRIRPNLFGGSYLPDIDLHNQDCIEYAAQPEGTTLQQHA